MSMVKLATSISGAATNIIKASIPQLRIFQRYAAVELVPPSPKDIPVIRAKINQIIQGAKTGSYKQITVREAWLNTLVTIEVWSWFFIGECIGKRHLVGYDA